jgi:hypothetical protein
VVGRVLNQDLMWTVSIEVRSYSGSTARACLLVVQQNPVSALGSDAASEAFRERFARGVLGGILTMSMPSAVNTASKDLVNLASPSRIRKRNAAVRLPTSTTTLRAC